MSNVQYGSFEVQSTVMQNLLKLVQQNTEKKFFIIVGDAGSGKSTMVNYINKVVFHNAQQNIFEDVTEFNAEVSSAIISTSKEAAYEVIKKFAKDQTFIVEMPNLSERKADIIVFTQFFLQVLSLMSDKKTVKLTDKAAEKLLQYNWPGNFRELESVLEEAFETSFKADNKATIEPEHITLTLPTEGLAFNIGQKLDEVERKYILQTLYFVHQNRTKAAEILGISIRTLRNKINQYREEGYL
jgi:two-component system response regulator FlrC